jgi:hypothetical protein
MSGEHGCGTLRPMRHHVVKRRQSHHGKSAAAVSLHVRDLSQMFSSLDPSPFWDRDLDPNAAAFIEDEFGDKGSAAVWHLNIHAQEGTGLAPDLQTAVESYYGRMASAARRKLSEHRRMGHLALAIGFAVFLLCVSAREIIARFIEVVPRPLDEGLIILAWIALWRPIEILAYEWVPLVRKRRFYERLAGVRVAVRSDVAVRPTGT